MCAAAAAAAAYLRVSEGVAAPSDIDQCMKLGANHPMGPLALCDMIGLDTILSVMEVLHREFGDDKYRCRVPRCPFVPLYLSLSLSLSLALHPSCTPPHPPTAG